jgi:hypothetical protein
MLAFEQIYCSKKDKFVQVIAEKEHQARSPKDQPNAILQGLSWIECRNVDVLTTSTQA